MSQGALPGAVRIRELSRSELADLWSIDRSERIDRIVHHEAGRLVVRDEHYDMKGWPDGEPEHMAEILLDCFEHGGSFYGAFDADGLAGAAVLESRFIGRDRDQLQLKFLHVSRRHRGTGLGSRLFGRALARARELGARRLYVSATPSENTIAFYAGVGCRLVDELDPELFALEPKDIHLECAVPQTLVTPLVVAGLVLPEFHPEGPGSDSVRVFLVRSAGHCVLFDAGVGEGSALIDDLYRPDRVPLAAALSEAGVSEDEVTAVVASHLHFDHCGGNGLFAGRPIFVQRRELEAAGAPGYSVPDWVDPPGVRYVELDGAHALSETVFLVPTPGHTAGHQSLVVRDGDRVEIVVGQAAYSAEEFQFFGPGESDSSRDPERRSRYLASNASFDPDAYQRSLEALHALGPDLAHFSHDSRVWRPDFAGSRLDRLGVESPSLRAPR